MTQFDAILADALPAMRDVVGRGLSVVLRQADGSTTVTCTPAFVTVVKGEPSIDDRGLMGERVVQVGILGDDARDGGVDPRAWVTATYDTETWHVDQPPELITEAVVVYRLRSATHRERSARSYREGGRR